ncbi:hypothetical protein AF335_20560 [Streptomyces eurocidicus]|uniref:PqqD family protein n=1 Tax=Streptomyces eurocidicus TaxID=66423 RepID=A0A2N8NTP4_STREU|nr:hypothetical protein [Streptomyces eurocidicus]MBB5119430.1 hypothetical protein [Streptomyces eurocidicus]MBF6052991.1 hypothetical protein [Streptomyces eurocidicus]PNE32127.1 hypothetical protein AF335_20560 [Streptomyces eurocidicus]
MWQLREGSRPVLTDEGGAILNERTGRWTYLTPTASAAVLFLLASGDQGQASEQYSALYRLSPEQAAADVRAVADALTTQGISRELVPRTRRWGWWR